MSRVEKKQPEYGSDVVVDLGHQAGGGAEDRVSVLDDASDGHGYPLRGNGDGNDGGR